jgi:hypothetical protein
MKITLLWYMALLLSIVSGIMIGSKDAKHYHVYPVPSAPKAGLPTPYLTKVVAVEKEISIDEVTREIIWACYSRPEELIDGAGEQEAIIGCGLSLLSAKDAGLMMILISPESGKDL